MGFLLRRQRDLLLDELYIRQLKPTTKEERDAALARTFGCLSPEEANELERVIEEGCEQINEHGW